MEDKDVTEDVELQAYLNEVSLNGTGPSGGLGRVNMTTNHKTYFQQRPRSHVSRYFLIRNFSFPETASIHTHPANPDK